LNKLDVIEVLDNCFSEAIKENASDIHLETKTNYISIKYRVDGVLREKSQIQIQLGPQIFSRLKVLINADITKKNIPQEGRFSFGGQKDLPKADIRVVILNTVLGEKAVLRLLNRIDLLKPLTELGMSSLVVEKYAELLYSKKGLVLITGATGSGKTTSLYASLLKVKTETKNVITVEDPVEYKVEDINQIQVNSESGLTFFTALKYILRMDPDIIFIGEIRDKETAALACSAALTGHLVIATIHTNNAISTITRLYDMGVDPFMIAHSLIGILSQSLIPKLCMFCKGEGCDKCSGKGIDRRLGVFELLIVNSKLRELIIKPPYTIEKLKSIASENFYLTLEEDAKQKMNEGLISEKEYSIIRKEYT
jgi:type II secretory ATPase GspE/PulE/Tfp pilus assembly ATPase PilB-like protein